MKPLFSLLTIVFFTQVSLAQGLCEIQLTDGSTILAKPLFKEVEADLKHGKVKIPITDLEEIKFGYYCEENLEKSIKENITKLNSNVFKNRQEAAIFLYQNRYFSYYLLKKAESLGLNFDRQKEILLEKISKDSFNNMIFKTDTDSFKLTDTSSYNGKLSTKKFQFESKILKNIELELHDINYIRFKPVDVELKIDISKLLQDAPWDSGIKVIGKVHISISGYGRIDYQFAPNPWETEYMGNETHVESQQDVWVAYNEKEKFRIGTSIQLYFKELTSLNFGTNLKASASTPTSGHFVIRIKQL